MNKKAKFTFRSLINKIDWWIRANITRREHWLRISKHPISYADIDIKVDLALVALARSYLEDELGRESDFTIKQKEGMVFYKGYRQHFHGDDTLIDCCLELLNAYNANRTLYKFNRRARAVKRMEYENRLTAALVDFVKQRRSMWT